MKIFLEYIKKHINYIIFLCVFVVVFAYIFYLYQLPLGAVFYPSIIFGVIMIIWGIFNYGKFYSKHKLMQNILNEITISMQNLPPAKDLVEHDYQALLQAFTHEKSIYTQKADEKYSNLINYYTTWVHQIKTPISAINLLLKSDNSAINKEISEELFRIEQYVDMVLTYLRLDGEGNDYIIRSYDLDKIIKQALRKFASQFIRRKSISLIYQEVNFRVITDDKWLLFVIEQLLSNALKYTKSGKISILLENDVLIISDTGIGIDEADLARMFSRGFTGINGHESKKASGIGLYLCKKICTNLNHEIKIESTPNKGTSVKISLNRPDLSVE